MKKLMLLATLFAPVVADAYEGPGQPIDGPEQHCYGLAMVGFDSVINSRLGVKPEHVLDLAELKHVSNGAPVYQPYVLKVVLDAYLWQSSAHNYAVRVMYNCARNDVKLYTAGVDGENVQMEYVE